MTDSNQAEYAGVIKKVHAELRAKCQEDGSTAEDVWRSHLAPSNEAQLAEYASSMRRLATDVWDVRHGGAPELSRIAWLHGALLSYHTESELVRARTYDDRLAARHGLTPHQWLSASALTSLAAFDTLDVGSCYGPFCDLPRLRVTALDLCPAAARVLRGDLLSVPLSERTVAADGRLLSLAAGAWHAVLFCLLLEYLPTPWLRYECCRRAAALLRPEGVLLVASPDSAHRTANGPLYRAWRLALATLGLVRVRYEKTEHLHCMVFRKSLHPIQVALEARRQLAEEAARGRLVWCRRGSEEPRPLPGTGSGGRDADRTGSDPGLAPRPLPGTGSGGRGADRTGSDPGMEPRPLPGTGSGGRDADRTGSDPGLEPRPLPGTGSGGRDADRTGSDPGMAARYDGSDVTCSQSSQPGVSDCPEPGVSDCPEPGVSDCPEPGVSDCPEPYQLMVIHQDLKPTVLRSAAEKAPCCDATDVEEALAELPQL